MFPIPFNFPFRKSNGNITTISAAISEGGSYELPTASANTKGGVKIGTTLEMSDETLNAKSQLPAHTIAEAGKVLTVGDDGSLEWDENGGAGVEILTQAEWDELTTAEKQAKGIVAVQTSNSGFFIGYLVDGSEYTLFRFEQLYLGEGSYVANIEGDQLTIDFTNVPNVGGAIISTDDMTVTGVSIWTNTGAVQGGTCLKSATLPTVITRGEGRLDWGKSSYTLNPTNMNMFIGTTSSSGGSYRFIATLTRN